MENNKNDIEGVTKENIDQEDVTKENVGQEDVNNADEKCKCENLDDNDETYKNEDEDKCETAECDENFKNNFEALAKSLEKKADELKEENSKLKNENDTLKDRLARNVAEYDNYRKRTAKEKEGIYTDACEDILKAILPVLDNLERAVSVEGNVDDLKKGVEMTMKQFNTALEKLSVEEINTDSEFDPHFHNAVMHIDDDSYDKNQIVEVFQKGYKRGEKVLRYSMVKVAN
ncbi:nucleotide exchange factor GrpE [Clostridium sp. JN-1]|uniref:nucleotide exchange factor GrpE n=1 Tax=Clostridium sp. JN-1 TaxID=2483110 RepID=UPI000F0B9138|nr:nucleotide exchange factor GrpE [Clostridium sp. JN-1]